MSQLLVAVFDTPTQAQLALDVLHSDGMSRDDLHLGTAAQMAVRTDASGRQSRADSVEDAVARSNSVKESIGDLFNTLFVDTGQPQSGTEIYREALRRGHVALSALVHSPDQAQRVRERLYDLGALDLRLREPQWRAQGWKGGSGETTPVRPDASGHPASVSSGNAGSSGQRQGQGVATETLDDERRHNAAVAALRADDALSDAALPAGPGFDEWSRTEPDGQTVGIFPLPARSRDRGD